MVSFNKGLQETKSLVEFTKHGEEQPAAPEWSKYVGASGLVSQEDVNALRVVEGQTDEATNELMATGSNAADFGKAALHILKSVTDSSVLKYTLQLVENVLLLDLPGLAEKLFSAAAEEADLLSGTPQPQDSGLRLQLEPFVALTRHEDVLVQGKAVYLSALLISVSGMQDSQDAARKAVLSVVHEQLTAERRDSWPQLAAALQSLSVLLRRDVVRRDFDARGGVNVLMDLMDRCFSALGSDAKYLVMLCTWLACFEASALARIDQAALGTLVGVFRGDPMPRVVRLCLSTIRLALEVEERQKVLCEATIELKLPKLLGQYKQKRGLKDEELLNDIAWLEETLVANFKVLTTFERHEQELLSKKLSWSMIHEEIFWRENALKFEHNNFESIRRLVELLASEDKDTVAVACSDLGFFVQFFPNGKLIVDKYGGKQEIMKLLQHESPEVQKHALSACSKIMVTNWESFKSSS